MYKIILTTLLVCNLNLNVILAQKLQAPIVISIGNACGVAGALQDYQLRDAAYPFDWIVSPFESLCTMFETNFKDFLNKHSLKIRPDGGAVIDTLYNFEFVHDFPTHESINESENGASTAGQIRHNFLEYFANIESKYVRRIERLRNILQSQHKVIFIRNRDITMDQAMAFCNLLETQFPQLDFLLILVDDENKMTINMDLYHPRIKNFYGSRYIQYGEGKQSVIKWKNIFMELGLI